MSDQITIQTTVHSPIAKVWDCWNLPEHITHWAFASDDWEAPSATNDLKVGGKFTTRMQAKANSEMGFDFGGTYDAITPDELIEYTMDGDDHRQVKIVFKEVPGGVHITQTFDAETENSIEKQRAGWQSILDNFKKYVESSTN